MEIIKNIKTYDDFENLLNGKIVDFSEKENGIISSYYPEDGNLEIVFDLKKEIEDNYLTIEEVLILKENLENEYKEKLVKYCCLTAGAIAMMMAFASQIFIKVM